MKNRMKIGGNDQEGGTYEKEKAAKDRQMVQQTFRERL
jgi:hypothetical protein